MTNRAIPPHLARALAILVALAGLALSACSGGGSSTPEESPGGTASESSDPTDTDETTPPATVEEVDDAPTGFDLALEPLGRLTALVAGAARPGSDSLFIAQQTGQVVELAFDADGSVSSEPTVVIDIGERVLANNENGLLGIAFSPDGTRLFAVFSDLDADNQLVSWEMAPDGRADPETELFHMEVEQPFLNHNGGQIAFGPDGYLYYGLGDGGGAGDPDANGQDRATLLGSMLRIDPDVVDGGYTVPGDNPFVDDAGSAPEIWAYGMRNPWRFSFDAETGDLWVADVGDAAFEEINLLPSASGGGRGANLGWSAFEGHDRFADVEAEGALPPLLVYGRDGRCAVIGGYVYRGSAIPALDGVYLYSDFCDGVVRGVVPGVGSAPLVAGESGQALSFAEGPDGEVYLLEADGTVSRLVDQSS